MLVIIDLFPHVHVSHPAGYNLLPSNFKKYLRSRAFSGHRERNFISNCQASKPIKILWCVFVCCCRLPSTRKGVVQFKNKLNQFTIKKKKRINYVFWCSSWFVESARADNFRAWSFLYIYLVVYFFFFFANGVTASSLVFIEVDLLLLMRLDIGVILLIAKVGKCLIFWVVG